MRTYICVSPLFLHALRFTATHLVTVHLATAHLTTRLLYLARNDFPCPFFSLRKLHSICCRHSRNKVFSGKFISKCLDLLFRRTLRTDTLSATAIIRNNNTLNNTCSPNIAFRSVGFLNHCALLPSRFHSYLIHTRLLLSFIRPHALLCILTYSYSRTHSKLHAPASTHQLLGNILIFCPRFLCN